MTLSKERIREIGAWAEGEWGSAARETRDLCQQALRAIELEAELKKIRSVIPMNFLIAHDTPGATGPTDALDLVGAIRSLVHNARKWVFQAESYATYWAERHGEARNEIERLRSKLREQKAAHAKMLRDEADEIDDSTRPVRYTPNVLHRLADKIEGEP